MVEYIFHALNRGTSIVLEFGIYGNTLAAYVLVANYLTRRIHAKYVEKKNKAAGQQGDEPRPLVITIEEAHKFLDPRSPATPSSAPSPASCASTTSPC